VISYNFSLPSGPSIILTAGLVYLASIALGTRDSLRTRYFPRAHFHD
jgi:zinc/manganese transport system permease protein